MKNKAILIILVIAAFVAFVWWYTTKNTATKSKKTEPDNPNPDLNPDPDIWQTYTPEDLEVLEDEYNSSRHNEDFKTWILSLSEKQADSILNKNKRPL